MGKFWVQKHDIYHAKKISMEKYKEWKFTNEEEGKWAYVLGKEKREQEEKEWEEMKFSLLKDVDELLVVIEKEIVDKGGYDHWYKDLDDLPGITQDGRTIEEDANDWRETLEFNYRNRSRG